MAFDIKEALTRKIGPLPVVVWVAIPAGAYVAYSYYRAATGGEEPLGDDFAPVTDEFDTGYPTLPGYDNIDDSTVTRPNPPPDPYDNKDWERDAIAWAIGQRLSPTDAVIAVRAYLYGRPSSINTGQMDILRKILTAKGAAPNGGNIPPLVRNPDNRPPTDNRALPRPPSAVGIRKIQGKLQATWNASPTANVRYEVEHKLDKRPWVLMRTVEVNHIEWEARAGAHTVRVRAKNRQGYSSYVNSNTLTIAKATFAARTG